MRLLSSLFGINDRCLFTSFLRLLNVRHNKSFSDAYYNKHPYNDSLYGLSSMLQDYGVENMGLRLDDKEQIVALEVPFIAQIATDFVIVSRIASDKVDYIWRGERIRSTLASFFETWTGVVLIAETDENSAEPDYKKYYKEETFSRIRNYTLGITVFVLSLLSFTWSGGYSNWGTTLLLAANLCGMYISLLLVLKQIDVHSEYADKLCSLFNKNGCSNILETAAAKFMGVISWSEVGLSYFTANLFIIIFAPQFMEYLVILNLCALPYSFWSIWYQKFRAKQWCMLCMAVQGVLWLVAGINFIFSDIYVPQLISINTIYAGFIYLIPYLIISLLLPVVINVRQQEKSVQQMSGFKMREDIFRVLLGKQPHYEVSRATSQIIFGNPDANLLITILSNPHCNPCAKMHKRVERVLKDCNNDLCIQYIFSSFGEEYQDSNVFLTAVYLNNGMDFTQRIYDEWFTWGSVQRERFFAQYLQNTSDQKVQDEFRRHQDWIDKTKLRVTPTVLINGHLLPEEYKIEDIKYFKDVNLFPGE